MAGTATIIGDVKSPLLPPLEKWDAFRLRGVVVKQTTPAIALLSARWPADFPRDPADRVIAATARAEGLPLVTSDARLRRSRLVETVW